MELKSDGVSIPTPPDVSSNRTFMELKFEDYNIAYSQGCVF